MSVQSTGPFRRHSVCSAHSKARGTSLRNAVGLRLHPLPFRLLALGLLIVVSMLWVERPPQVRWLRFRRPRRLSPVTSGPAHGRHTISANSNPSPHQIIAPLSVPRETPRINDAGSGPTVAEAPTIGSGIYGGPSIAIGHGLGDGFPVVIPVRPAPVKPLVVSHWAEGNLIYRRAADLSDAGAAGAGSGHGRVAGDCQQGGDDRESGPGSRTPDAVRGRDRGSAAMALSAVSAEQRADPSGDRDHGELSAVGKLDDCRSETFTKRGWGRDAPTTAAGTAALQPW